MKAEVKSMISRLRFREGWQESLGLQIPRLRFGEGWQESLGLQIPRLRFGEGWQESLDLQMPRLRFGKVWQESLDPQFPRLRFGEGWQVSLDLQIPRLRVRKDLDPTRSTFNGWLSVHSTVGDCQDISVLRTNERQVEEPNWKELLNELRAERDIQEKRIQTRLEANSLEGLKSPTSSRPTQYPKVETIGLQMDDQPIDLRTDSPSMEPQIDGQAVEPRTDGPSMEPQIDDHMLELVVGEYYEGDDNSIDREKIKVEVDIVSETPEVSEDHRHKDVEISEPPDLKITGTPLKTTSEPPDLKVPGRPVETPKPPDIKIELDSRISRWTDIKTELDSKISRWTDINSELDSKISRWTDIKTELDSKISRWTDIKTELDSKISRWTDIKSELDSKISRWTDIKSELDSKISRWTDIKIILDSMGSKSRGRPDVSPRPRWEEINFETEFETETNSPRQQTKRLITHPRGEKQPGARSPVPGESVNSHPPPPYCNTCDQSPVPGE